MDIQIEYMSKNHLCNINFDDFDDFWNIHMLEEELSLNNTFYIIAKCNNLIAGFAGISIILDEAHISNIAVKKDMRGRKIGSLLLERLIKEASKKCSFITLEVNEKNLPAIQLYEKYGFINLGKRKKYYNNKFDAYIMTKYFK